MNIQAEGVIALKSGLKTYLFSIGKYMFYKRLKERQKLHLIHSIEETSDFDELKIKDTPLHKFHNKF